MSLCNTVQKFLLRGSMSSSPVCAAEHTPAHFMTEANKVYKNDEGGRILSCTSCA